MRVKNEEMVGPRDGRSRRSFQRYSSTTTTTTIDEMVCVFHEFISQSRTEKNVLSIPMRSKTHIVVQFAS